MTPPTARGVARAVELAHRSHWPAVLAATVRLTRDLDLAEECVQEAYLRALAGWAAGVPDQPAAWLTTVARRTALDRLRRESVLRGKLPLLLDRPGEDADPGTDPLRLLFVSCHPALSPDSRVALTLRLMCGLTTAEVATGLLLPEATVAARVTRAKKKIAGAGIPFRVPTPQELADRLDAVLTVLQVLHAAGHSATGEQLVRRDLTERATLLARLLVDALPGSTAARSLLALVLLTSARHDARTSATGDLVLLPDQDRERWDPALLREGLSLVTGVLTELSAAGTPPDRFTVQAVIAGLHADAPSWERTDWPAIVRWYDELHRRWPSPVVALNRAVARGRLPGADPAGTLQELDALTADRQLTGYPYLAAARAVVLAELGRTVAARAAFDQAIATARNDVERADLRRRRAALGPPS